MKKGSKLKRIAGLFIVLFTVGAIVVAHVALKKKCDDLIKHKVDAEEELQNQNTKKNNLLAKYQSLTSEDRVVAIALFELGMTIADPPVSVVTIDSEKISDLQILLQEQYD